MSQTVEIPGVGTLEFPDGMSQPDMAAAIQKNFPQLHQSQPQPSTDAGRIAALGGRSIGEGVFDTLAAPHDLGVWMQNKMRHGINSVFGTQLEDQPTFASNLSDALTTLGAPTPQTENERSGTAIARGVTGALTGGGVLGAANPSLLTTPNLVRTGISGATSSGAAEATRRYGGGSFAQFVASLIGGGLPFLGGRGAPQNATGPSARATASTTPGQASATTNISGNLQASSRGGGSMFGTVGADESAALTTAQQRAADAGTQLGMRLTPGQASGSTALQQFEAKLESQPMTSGPFNTLKSVNQKVLNRVTAAAIGESSDVVDAATLERANERLGDVFENVRNPSRILAVDPTVTATTLDHIDSDFQGLLPGDMSIRANPLVAQLEKQAQTGGINGQQLGQLSSKLGRAAAKQMTTPNGDRDLGQALYQVKDHVDDLLQSQLTGDEATAYAGARQQYRNLMLLTGRSGIVNPSSGNVSGAALANRLQQADKNGFLFGKNQSDWYNAARFAQAFKPIVGDSGTATRSMNTSPTDFVLSLPFSLATHAYLKTPAATASAVASGVTNPGRMAMNAAGGLLNPMLLPAIQSGILGPSPGLMAAASPAPQPDNRKLVRAAPRNHYAASWTTP
jgi:hypothetical protein